MMDVEMKKPWRNQKCNDCGRTIREFYVQLNFGYIAKPVRVCPECFLRDFVTHKGIFNFWNVQEACAMYKKKKEEAQHVDDVRSFMKKGGE